jgi:hypothetical protein
MSELSELRELPVVDVEANVADRIAARARAQVGSGESPWRFAEPVLVTGFTTSILVWTIMMILEVFR